MEGNRTAGPCDFLLDQLAGAPPLGVRAPHEAVSEPAQRKAVVAVLGRVQLPIRLLTCCNSAVLVKTAFSKSRPCLRRLCTWPSNSRSGASPSSPAAPAPASLPPPVPPLLCPDYVDWNGDPVGDEIGDGELVPAVLDELGPVPGGGGVVVQLAAVHEQLDGQRRYCLVG